MSDGAQRVTAASWLLAGAAAILVAGCNGFISDPGVSDPEGGDAPEEACELCVGDSPTLRLTRLEYERTLRTVLGDAIVDELRLDHLPSDGTAGPFASNAFFDVNDDGVEAYRAVAESVGEIVMIHADDLLGCDGAAPDCVDLFLTRLGTSFYRRPLDGAELTAYRALFEQAASAGTYADGVRLVITAFLQAPSFLYRIEVGVPSRRDGVRELTGYELATRLSFFLWKSGPDQALLDAAEAGLLDTPQGVESEARRLLSDPRADLTIARFHTEWLGVDDLMNHRVDDTRYPTFEDVKDDMLLETETFALHVFRTGDARLETLLTAPYSFMTPELAQHYGIDEALEPGTMSQVMLDPSERAGILTHASFITSHGNDPASAAVHRGKAIRERLLCLSLPPPPAVNTIIAPDPTLSSRQQLEQKTSPTACATCHQLMNPLGFPFEHYDVVGAFRELDGPHPIDASGTVVGTDVDGDVDGAIDLAGRLAQSEDVHRCVARQWFRFALGRSDAEQDEPSLEAAYQRYRDSGDDLRELIIAITTTDAFRLRGVP